MKGISLHQPWAAGIALGHKRWETRTRSAPRSVRFPGQRVFLHAAATTGSIRTLLGSRQGMDLLRAVGYYGDGRNMLPEQGQQGRTPALAFGALVATARIGRVLPIVATYELAFVEGACIALDEHRQLTVFGDLATGDDSTVSIHDQLPWGDWSPGRWAWELLDVRPLPSISDDPTLIMPGRQGWWQSDHPALVAHEHVAA